MKYIGQNEVYLLDRRWTNRRGVWLSDHALNELLEWSRASQSEAISLAERIINTILSHRDQLSGEEKYFAFYFTYKGVAMKAVGKGLSWHTTLGAHETPSFHVTVEGKIK